MENRRKRRRKKQELTNIGPGNSFDYCTEKREKRVKGRQKLFSVKRMEESFLPEFGRGVCEWEFVYKCPAFSNLEMEEARSLFGERRRILAPLFYVVIFL